MLMTILLTIRFSKGWQVAKSIDTNTGEARLCATKNKQPDLPTAEQLVEEA
jgi:hypothetical protein